MHECASICCVRSCHHILICSAYKHAYIHELHDPVCPHTLMRSHLLLCEVHAFISVYFKSITALFSASEVSAMVMSSLSVYVCLSVCLSMSVYCLSVWHDGHYLWKNPLISACMITCTAPCTAGGGSCSFSFSS